MRLATEQPEATWTVWDVHIEIEAVEVTAGPGWARHGLVRRGMARPGRARRGKGANGTTIKGVCNVKERRDEITTAVDSLTTLSADYDRGHCIAWSDIESIAGPRKENRGKHIILKWRKRLKREREIVTLCAASVGVRLLTHKEVATEIPRYRQRRAYRQIRRAMSETRLVDVESLSLSERKMLVAQRENMARQRLELHRSQKQAANGNVTESNPKRKVQS